MWRLLSLSIVMRRKDNRFIDLKSLGVQCDGFPVLSMNTTFVRNQIAGTMPILKIAEKPFLTNDHRLGSALISCAGAMSSGAGDLKGLKLVIAQLKFLFQTDMPHMRRGDLGTPANSAPSHREKVTTWQRQG
ncbi:hypothetical protein KR074_000978 [Drosophila pseudoananassae]|nr:hypothetical protein KR074_000978 [Drosophila pseudoananassae]